MVIFFLQHQNILPSVEDLQINMGEDLCCGWNFAFNKEYEFVTDIGNNSSNVSKLLTDFFRFYIHFPYETHIICLLVGQPVKRYNLKYSFNMPNILSESPSFGSKKDKLKLNKILVVQDPFELAKNVARSVSKSNIGKCKPFLYIFIYQFGS